MMLKFNRTCDSVIIAGNGNSLKDIDYSLLPKEFDVFRCNQFYFEDSYYLGKEIKAVFFTSHVLLEQYYTLKKLISNNEYQCEYIIVSNHCLPLNENDLKVQNLLSDVINGYEEIISKLNKFDIWSRFNEVYENKRITSGIYMCAAATALGYKNIYITGIDFYPDIQTSYVFNHKKENLLKLLPEFGAPISHSLFHSKDMDLQALIFLQENYHVNFYAISPNSPICEYIPLASVSQSVSQIFGQIKHSDSIKDILIPPKHTYQKLGISENTEYKRRLYKNTLFKVFYDLLHLPGDIKHYLKEKKKQK